MKRRSNKDTKKISAFRNTVSFVSRTVMIIENTDCPTILIEVNRYCY